MAMDVDRPDTLKQSMTGLLPEQKSFIPITKYFERYEEEERNQCKRVNYSLLNEQLDSEEDDFGDVAEEVGTDIRLY